MFFTFDPLAKAELHLSFAAERVAEAKAMAEAGKHEHLPGLTSDYEGGIEEASKIVAAVQEAGRDITKVSEVVALATSVHIEVLEGVHEEVPEEAKPALKRAIQASITGQESCLDSLGKVLPERSARLYIEIVEKRIEVAKEKARLGKASEAEEIVREYGGKVNKSLELIEEAERAGKDVEELIILVGNATSRHIKVLIEVYDLVPDIAKPAIEKAINASMHGREQAIESLEEINPERVREIEEALPEEVKKKVGLPLLPRVFEFYKECWGLSREEIEKMLDDPMLRRGYEDLEKNLSMGLIGGIVDYEFVCRRMCIEEGIRPDKYAEVCRTNPECCRLPEIRKENVAEVAISLVICNARTVYPETTEMPKIELVNITEHKYSYTLYLSADGAISPKFYLTKRGCLVTCKVFAPPTPPREERISLNLEISPTSIVTGEQVNISFSIVNEGLTKLEGYTFRILDPTKTMIHEKTVTIEPGQLITGSLSWESWNAEIGTYEFMLYIEDPSYAVVASTSKIIKITEEGLKLWVSPVLPKLNYTVGETVQINYRIANDLKTAIAPPFKIELIAGFEVLESWDSIAPGQVIEGSINWTIPDRYKGAEVSIRLELSKQVAIGEYLIFKTTSIEIMVS
jgi:hypothetical protein